MNLEGKDAQEADSGVINEVVEPLKTTDQQTVERLEAFTRFPSPRWAFCSPPIRRRWGSS